jgi:hypothetical protein
VPKRYTKAGKKASAKKRRNKIKLHEDKEINELLRIYRDIVKVVHDTNP